MFLKYFNWSLMRVIPLSFIDLIMSMGALFTKDKRKF